MRTTFFAGGQGWDVGEEFAGVEPAEPGCDCGAGLASAEVGVGPAPEEPPDPAGVQFQRFLAARRNRRLVSRQRMHPCNQEARLCDAWASTQMVWSGSAQAGVGDLAGGGAGAAGGAGLSVAGR
ncbi:MAG: hypothetical protein WCA20_04370 [Candidatus Sulfotelmatobacter sp.]